MFTNVFLKYCTNVFYNDIVYIYALNTKGTAEVDLWIKVILENKSLDCNKYSNKEKTEKSSESKVKNIYS